MNKPGFPLIKIASIIILPLALSIYLHSLSWWGIIKIFLDIIIIFLSYQFLKDAINEYKYQLKEFEKFTLAEEEREKRRKQDERFKEQEKIRKEKVENEKLIIIESRKKEVFNLKENIFNKINEIGNSFTDDSGKVKLISNDFSKLLAQHEKQLIEIENNSSKSFVLKFVKISNYIKEKQNRIQDFYQRFKDISDQFKKETNFNINNLDSIKKQIQFLNDGENKLKKQISIYEQSIFHSINMITSLIENKMFVFYEIFEVFDKAGVFDSKWQTVVINKLDSIDNNLVDISNKLDSLNKKLDEIIDSIKELDNNIQSGFENLSYCFQDSISDLGSIVSNELEKINSNLQFNNLLTAVQTRKLYQIKNDIKKLN